MNNTLGNIFKGDKVIWMVFFFLCLISVIEVYSSISRLTYSSGNYILPLVKHIGILMLGIFCMVVTLNIKCKYFKVATPLLLLVSIIALIVVFVIAMETNGAKRWIPLPGMQFQPSEIAKGTLVLACAQILSAMQTDKGADRKAFKYVLCISALIIPLIFVENFSTAALMSAVVFVMMLIGRVPMSQLGRLLGIAVLIMVVALAFVMQFGVAEDEKKQTSTTFTETKTVAEKEKKNSNVFEKITHRSGTWKSRIIRFVDNTPHKPTDIDLKGKDSQAAHANIAIVSSGVFGKGLGRSEECDYLYNASNDFIYAIIIEEMGILGAVFVALLYVILLFRTGHIASQCENNFPAFLAMGLAVMIAIQALFHMLVSVGLAPVTGQPLPLVSRGGTSTIMNCIYIGVILSVSRSAKKKDMADKAVAAKSVVTQQ